MGGVASGYLDSPITDKEVSDGVSKLGMSYGAASMQGWRNNNEDAMSCLPDFTEDSAMFAVYDGHGGPEVALYTAKYLPMLLKTHYAFKGGDVKHALREAFLAVDKQIVLEETIDELQTLAGTKPDDDDDDQEEKLEEMKELHEEAALPLAALLAKYKKQMAECIAEEEAEMEEKFKGSGKGKKVTSEKETEEEVENGDGADAGEDAGADAGVAVAAAAVEGAVEGIAKKANGAGTSNGEATEKDEDEDDEDFLGGDEEESASETDDDDDDESDDEDSGSEDDEDDEIAPSDEREGWGSGTTACVAVVKGGVITVANVGDSRCVVCTEGIAKDLSVDHKPEEEVEKTRIEKAGGRISKEGRVNGGLNLSRALGDHQYKVNTELQPEEQMISPLPDLMSHTIAKEDEFMLVACDGIWNCMSSQEAVDFVREHIADARQGGECSKSWLSDISSKLMDRCLAADTSGDGCGCDNMTAVIVLLNQDSQSKRKLSETEEAENKKAKY